jgi:two-component sensor histidine kinase
MMDPFKKSSAADIRQDMLSDELHHRVQNTLAIVLALARLTARSCKTIDEFQVAFGDRVQAMARTNALLLRGNAQAIDVRAALEVELEPYVSLGGPVTLECEALSIGADAALSLSLLIHELATNAAKYGALSTAEGRLVVSCTRQGAGGVLAWRETTPNLVVSEITWGAGSGLIERLARELGGEARRSLLPTGLDASITFALER